LATAREKFSVIEECDLSEEYGRGVVGTLFQHEKTGAEVLSLKAPDKNKVFGITFLTPPTASDGVAHILEHSVLCGSKKYPLKEPFGELLKGSMSTFLNAFTYPDRTVYPVASQNLKDFYNLASVYADAVFFPNLTPLVFAQEGWHYEVDSEGNLNYKGIVFNEMKGVYSQPDAMIHRHAMGALFPDSMYGLDSGGDPSVIPSLTFDGLKEFHSMYYRPSNARIFFFGDDDEEERLRFVDNVFADFVGDDAHRAERIPPPSVPYQLKSGMPLPTQRFPYSRDEDPRDEAAGGAGHFAMLNWIVNDEPLSQKDQLVLGIVNHLLLGTSAGNLYRDLMDSGLGSAVIGGGFSGELQQTTFSAGLKGVSAEDVESVAEAVQSSLANTVFEPESIEAALNTMEFSLREFNTSGGWPRGLLMLLNANPSWMFNGAPFDALKFSSRMREIREEVEAGKTPFDDALQKFIVDNAHRVLVELYPSKTHGRDLEELEAEALRNARQSMSSSDLARIAEEEKILLERQHALDPPEVLAMVPSIEISDLDPEVPKGVPRVIEKHDGAEFLLHESTTTNGIVYVDFFFDLGNLSANDHVTDDGNISEAEESIELSLLPMLCRSLTETGTEKMSEIELVQAMGIDTGGVSASIINEEVRGRPGELVSKLVLRGKCVTDKVPKLLAIMEEVALSSDLSNMARIGQILQEKQMGFEASLLSSGHSFATSQLASHYVASDWVGSRTGGVSAFSCVKGLSAEPSLGDRLSSLRSKIIHKGNAKPVVVNITAAGDDIEATVSAARSFLASIPKESGHTLSSDGHFLSNFSLSRAQSADGEYSELNEALIVPTQVNFVARGGLLEAPVSGRWAVASRYLRNTWLWDQVRVVGGAYGGFCSLDRTSGLFTFASYRDPNFAETLEAYAGSGNFLRESARDMTDEDLKKATIGMISDLDTPKSAADEGFADTLRYLVGEAHESRQKWRDEVLSTQKRDFAEFGDAIDALQSRDVVVGASEILNAVSAEERKGWKERRLL